MHKTIAILLSTYNGEKYLSSLLDSLVQQTYTNFTIYIRDDGSSDRTMHIIKEYVLKYPDYFYLIEDKSEHLGVEKSFRKLTTIANAKYYFFCDQDDIWHPNKVEEITKAFDETTKAELIYSDFILIDENNNELKNKPHFNGAKKIDKINKGAFVNLIPGCCMAFNNLAKELFLNYYNNYHIHDELIFILTSVYGTIKRINTPLIKYRIHSNNTIGLNKSTINWDTYIKIFAKYLFNNKGYRKIRLESYFLLTDTIRKILPLKNDFFTEEEINKLNYLSRKRWFYKHFFPFDTLNKKEGIQQLLLI